MKAFLAKIAENKTFQKIKHIATQTFLKHVLLSIGIVVGGLLLTYIILAFYTHHGEALSVPDFRGMTKEQLEEAIDENNLNYEVIDSAFHSDKPRGSVLEQNPSPNFKVKRGRTIFITMNSHTPEKVQIPNLIDAALSQAKADLESNGLVLGKIQYMPSPFKNLVLQQKYKGRAAIPGKLIEKGQVIDLVLGSGEEEEGNDVTQIPDVVGLNQMDATQKVSDMYLNIGSMHFDKTVKSRSDSLRAVVWKQAPEANSGDGVSLGTSIDIWLTLDKLKLKLLQK